MPDAKKKLLEAALKMQKVIEAAKKTKKSESES